MDLRNLLEHVPYLTSLFDNIFPGKFLISPAALIMVKWCAVLAYE